MTKFWKWRTEVLFERAHKARSVRWFKQRAEIDASGADRNTLIEAAKSVRALPRIALRSKKPAPAPAS